MDTCEITEKVKTFLPSGFRCFDRTIGGYQNSALTVLGIDDHTIKSRLTLSLVLKAALTNKLPVLFFSFCTKFEELLPALIANTEESKKLNICLEKVSDKIRSSLFTDEETGLTISIIYKQPLSVEDLYEITTQMFSGEKKGIVIIDELAFLTNQLGSNQNLSAVIEYIPRKLMFLAGELEVPIILLIDFDGKPKYGEDKPSLKNFRHLPNLEYDAASILFVWSPYKYEIDESLNKVPICEVLSSSKNSVYAIGKINASSNTSILEIDDYFEDLDSEQYLAQMGMGPGNQGTITRHSRINDESNSGGVDDHFPF